VKAEPQVEPRAALRTAIQKHTDLTRRFAELTKAVPKAESAVFAARSGVEQASAALEDAKRAASSQAVAAAVGKTSGTPPSIAKARRVLEAAQDELETAKTAAADLGTQRKEVEQAVLMARSRLNDAVAAVVRSDPATQKLIKTFEQAHRQLSDVRQAVEFVLWRFFPQATRLSVLAERIDNVASAQRREWENAISALEKDPDLALPV
jgi:chromosome segregation ATPase